jgi:tRNA threonylcarbamoyl adenosine modification protein (Sua5/YciO/YrdC/YwlC family)
MAAVVIDLRHADDLRDVVHQTVQALVEGQIVAFPTETVYGLAASALEERAVQRLAAVKGRKPNHPLTLAIKSADEARDYVPEMSPLAQRLARRCWPGPVTLVVDDTHPDSLVRQLPDKVLNYVVPSKTLGLRVPGHQVLLDVLRMLVGPLALTSANRTGGREAVDAREVLEALGGDVDLVIDDGPCRFGEPSSVVRVVDNRYEILRAGVVPEKTLQRLSCTMVLFVCTGNTCRSPMAEAICRQLLAAKLGCTLGELEDRGAMVSSAGVAAMLGGRAAREAIEVLSEMGLDLSDHETQPLTEPLVRHADLIFTMTRSHREAILAQWPSAAERTLLLSADESDICDPIGGPAERYQRCAAQLRAALETRTEPILKLLV